MTDAIDHLPRGAPMNATAPSPVRGVAFSPSQRDKDVLVGLHHGAESAATFKEIDFAVRLTTAVHGAFTTDTAALRAHLLSLMGSLLGRLYFSSGMCSRAIDTWRVVEHVCLVRALRSIPPGPSNAAPHHSPLSSRRTRGVTASTPCMSGATTGASSDRTTPATRSRSLSTPRARSTIW